MAKSRLTVTKDVVGKFLKRLRDLGSTATVGIQGADAVKDHDGITMVDLGTIHEYGAPQANIPQRSFLRATYDEHEREYQSELGAIFRDAIVGKSSSAKGLRVLGEKARNDVIDRIRSNIPPPLQQSTIDRKGSDTALVDTGALLRSISVQVRPIDKLPGGAA